MSRTQRHKRRVTERRRWRLALGVIAGIVIGVVYILFFAPFMRVDAVAVEGVDAEETEELTAMAHAYLDRTVLWLLPGDALVLVNEERLAATIADAMPALRAITVNRRLAGTLHITATPRTPFGIVCRVPDIPAEDGADHNPPAPADEDNAEDDTVTPNEEQETTEDNVIEAVGQRSSPFTVLEETRLQTCYFFDAEGIVYKKAPQSRGGLITTLFIGSDTAFHLGARPLRDNVMQWLLATAETLREQHRLQVARFFVPHVPAGAVHVETVEGWWISLDVEADYLEQLRAVVALLEESLTPRERAELRYIDARVPGRVYYKATP